jgi:L-aminopeptidase/D-esterase-like protein
MTTETANMGKDWGLLGRSEKAPLFLGRRKCATDNIVVGAIVAVNAFGDVLDPATGETIAGPRDPKGKGLLSTPKLLRGSKDMGTPHPGNTTIGVVATKARLNKDEAKKLAQAAHDGLAYAIRPCHTTVDGDALFALSLARNKAEIRAESLGSTLAVGDVRNVRC